MEKNIKIGFIGAGKVGCSLGKYFQLHQIQLSGYYSRTDSSSQFASEYTGSNCYHEIQQLVAESTVIFITVADDQIALVWEQLLKTIEAKELKDKDRKSVV